MLCCTRNTFVLLDVWLISVNHLFTSRPCNAAKYDNFRVEQKVECNTVIYLIQLFQNCIQYLLLLEAVIMKAMQDRIFAVYDEMCYNGEDACMIAIMFC